MKKTNFTFMEKHSLIESKTNEILYNYSPCNKALVGILLSKDIPTRRNYLMKLIQHIILKFHLY
jgi:hypothetical protein